MSSIPGVGRSVLANRAPTSFPTIIGVAMAVALTVLALASFVVPGPLAPQGEEAAIMPVGP